MLHIGRSYIVRVDGVSRLCADLTIGNRRTTLWFGVDSTQEEYLTLGRADAFVMAVLPCAMRGRHEIVCEDPMSERLHHQLVNGLIPALSFAGERYHLIKITAPLTTEQIPNHGAVGTGFSGGVDSLYTIMKHDAASEFPLTHIAVFPRRFYDKSIFLQLCRHGSGFAQELDLKQVYLDSNMGQVLKETYSEVYSFRNYACALALQGLFSFYLLSSGKSVWEFKFDFDHVSYYDPLTVNCTSTESLSFYLSGAETTRAKKLEALTAWEPSCRWLHPCTNVLPGGFNCGRCRKCCCDLTVLYALGELDRYRSVFDVDDYLSRFPQRIGLLLSIENNRHCIDALQALKERNIAIPDYSVSFAKQIKKAREQQAAKLENQ